MKMINRFLLALILTLAWSEGASDLSAQSKPGAPANKPDVRVPINPPETGIVLQRNVSARGQAGFAGEVIARLHKGESVTLLEEVNKGSAKEDEPTQWYRIAMPTNTPVWVHAAFVDPASKTVTPRRLRVRAGPGENFSTVGMLEKGATVKEIRSVNSWLEIETPPGTYAFVAGDLIERTPAAPVIPPPAAPEVVAVAPAPDIAPAQPVIPDVVPTPAPTPAPAPAPEPEPVVAEVPPAIDPTILNPAPPVEAPMPKRIVTREGIVRRSINVQTPSYFELENPENRKIINYLYNPQPGFTLKSWIGLSVRIVGEESIDKRWPNTPVIEIETIDPR